MGSTFKRIHWRHRAAAAGAALLCAWYAHASVRSTDDKWAAEAFERAAFAGRDALPSGRFEYVKRTERRPDPGAARDVERLTGEFEQRVLEEVRRGAHALPAELKDELVRRYGSAEYERIKGAPGVTALLTRYAREQAGLHRRYVLERRAAHEASTVRFTVIVDHGGKSRIEQSVEHATLNGVDDRNMLMSSWTIAVDRGESRQLIHKEPREGFLLPGSDSRPDATTRWLYGFDPREAGHPTVLASGGWKADHVVRATGGGDEVTLVLAREGSAGPEVLVLKLLPGKDYRFSEYRLYRGGLLRELASAENYRPLSDGTWYPFKVTQTIQGSDALPEAIAHGLESGRLSSWEPDVLAAADQALVRDSTVSKVEVQSVDPFAVMPEEWFMLEFPPGTIVYDMRRPTSGPPERIVVPAGPKDHEAEENRSAVEDVESEAVPVADTHRGQVRATSLGSVGERDRSAREDRRTTVSVSQQSLESKENRTPGIGTMLWGAVIFLVIVWVVSRVLARGNPHA